MRSLLQYPYCPTEVSKVLVVDDSPDICYLVRLILEPEGHEVVEAYTGEAGLETLDAGECDVVLLDVNLPGLSGWDVLDRLRQLPGRGSAVVIMSAAAEDTFPENFREMGVTAVLPKPFSTKELVDVVALAAGSKR